MKYFINTKDYNSKTVYQIKSVDQQFMINLHFITRIVTKMVEEEDEFLSSEDKPIDYRKATSIYDFIETDINGEEVKFEKYRGHVCLIVNIATKCGLAYTNFQQLAELKTKYWNQGN